MTVQANATAEANAVFVPVPSRSFRKLLEIGIRSSGLRSKSIFNRSDWNLTISL